MKLILGQNTYHLRRRVPSRYKSIESRGEVWISLQTDSLKSATQKASLDWGKHLKAWEALLNGTSEDAPALFGMVKAPTMTVLQALDDFWTLTPDRVRGKSEDQKR